MERLKKFLFVGASSLLLFCFPAFAEEQEASELSIEEVNNVIDLVSDSREEASNIDIDSLSVIMSGPVKAPSINPNTNNKFIGINIINGSTDDSYKISFIVEGNPVVMHAYVSDIDYMAYAPDYISNNIPINTTIYYVYGNAGSGIEAIHINKTIGINDIGTSFTPNGDISNIGTYLLDVSRVFSWLLSTIGILITFILGNPFLAVSLLLFMAGTVISFYIRIKNS